ncbi:PucR family transcriptional regulator [Oceanobacillus alkalisoli]|uniref:PucR family transcriptional regulator n=1 Tax=Oceanobacillus alkalisoli TaxID=2925113 RepID=UPI001EE42A5D|nr:PucR family transcriptional regulator [Oceanobacillus alkalisoli]MCG5102415.1 PucR family transcriptional regulator ligand-binding domain-containing protein [Oceanobacillus alkalisoli]
MSITVQEIVNLPIFNATRVITGIDILDQRNVEWMAAIEGPVENFVREHEFVLTTGMGTEHDANLLYEFVKDVYESGASALGIAIGRYIFDIPDAIIDFAEEKKFVLIELPWELRFSDIQRETMKEINQRQESFSEKARDTQKTLIDFVIQGKDLAEIIQHVERELHFKLVFADRKGRLKSTQAGAEEMIRLWDILEENEACHVDELSFHHIQKVPYKNGFLLKKEITSGSNSFAEGYFIICLREQKLLTSSALQVLDSLAAATALWISRDDAIVQTEMRLQNGFIRGLAKTPPIHLDKNVQSRAKLFGYNLHVPYLCIVGYSENLDELTEGHYTDQGSSFKSIIYYMEEEVRYAATVVGKHAAFTYDEDQIIIFLESKNEEQSSVHHFLDLVDKRLHALIPGVLFSWGFGMHQDGLMTFHESYKKANSALDLGLKQKKPGDRMDFQDTQLNRLLLHLANHPEIKEITLSTIAPLIEYEEKRRMDLIDTFIAYDNQNGNVSQAARILHLHRQSLLYRLKKIESLTNLSLDNPDDVLLLNISIKVWLTGVLETKE